MPSYSSGTISIPNVTGNIVITATATAATVTSISAVFNQGQNVIYDTDSLDTLKQYLTVTATYDGGITAVVTGYTLSGILTVGTSTITASYGGKTDTFDVNVSISNLQYAYNIVGTGSVNTSGGVTANSNYNLTDFIDLDSNYTAFTFVHDAASGVVCQAQFFNGDTFVQRIGLSQTTSTTRRCDYSSLTVTKMRISYTPKTLTGVKLMKGLV